MLWVPGSLISTANSRPARVTERPLSLTTTTTYKSKRILKSLGEPCFLVFTSTICQPHCWELADRRASIIPISCASIYLYCHQTERLGTATVLPSRSLQCKPSEDHKGRRHRPRLLLLLMTTVIGNTYSESTAGTSLSEQVLHLLTTLRSPVR